MGTAATPTRDDDALPRVLGPTAALCVIVGSVIGSGIFLVPATVAGQVPYVGAIVLVWVVGGVFSAAGALTLAELSAMLPRAGGPYVYLRAAYGPLPAFLFGWTELLVVRTGAIATLAAAFARYVAQVVPAPGGLGTATWQATVAVSAIVLVTAVNVRGTAAGGRVQVVGTALKVGALAAMIALPLLLGRARLANLSPVWPGRVDADLFRGVLAAMVGVLWTYDGWSGVSQLAGEIRDPGRNVPRALILGMLILIVLYVGMTLTYHAVLPMDEVRADDVAHGADRAVAADFCRRLLGPTGVVAIALIVMASTFIALNGNTLTGPRTYFAMARDRLFPTALGRVHPRFRTPANAIVAQAAWAIVLTVVATALILSPRPRADPDLPVPLRDAWAQLNRTPLYDVLYTYVIFGAVLFYTLSIASVFVLRARRPDLPRPYRTWGYPATPILFVVASLILLGNMLAVTPFESLSGLLLIALGLPAFAIFRRRATTAA